MSEKRWKVVERKFARDVGVERIPVTGERDGADFEDAIACYQSKSRKCIPSWLGSWLSGIVGTPHDETGGDSECAPDAGIATGA